MPNLRALLVAVAVACVLPLTAVSPSTAAVLFDSDYATAGLSKWDGLHQPASGGRLSVQPGFGGVSGSVLKAEIRPGDHTYTGTYEAERAEVMGRVPPGGTKSAAAASWPDPVGSTRWYHFNVNLKAPFEVPTDSRWVEITQWKGLNGSVPPIGILAQKGRLVMKVKRSTPLEAADLGAATTGKWISFVIGIKFSTGGDGWVTVIRDGKTVVAKTAAPTMELLGGKVDPTYFKQGLYRGSGFSSTHIAYFSDLTVGTAQIDVDAGAVPGGNDDPPASSGSPSAGSGGTANGVPTSDNVISTTITPLPLSPTVTPGTQAPTTVSGEGAVAVPLLTTQAPRANVNVRRRASGRLRLDIDGLVRLRAGDAKCPTRATVKITWKKRKAFKQVKVVGRKTCRVRSFLMKPKLAKGTTVTLTVSGRGYRRHTAIFKL